MSLSCHVNVTVCCSIQLNVFPLNVAVFSRCIIAEENKITLSSKANVENNRTFPGTCNN